jgi:hypothetical protein
MKKFNIEKEIRKYRGTPFKYGGYGADGNDCIGFVHRFFTNMGVNMPDGVAEGNKENYSEIYLSDPDRADELLLAYFDVMPGVEVHPQEVLAGDAIIVRHERYHHLMPAVYGGNGIAITSFLRSEVKTFSLDKKLPIIKARRVI